MVRSDVDLARAAIAPHLRRTPTLRTTIDTVDGAPNAKVTFVALPDDYDDVLDDAESELWESDGDAELTDEDRARLFEVIHDEALADAERLELGSFTDFDRLFDVISLAADQAEAVAADLSAAGLRPVASAADIEAGAEQVRRVTIAPQVTAYIVDIARATRFSPSLALGVSPRGATALLGTSRAWAWLNGRNFVTPDDVQTMAVPTLSHRLALRP